MEKHTEPEAIYINFVFGQHFICKANKNDAGPFFNLKVLPET